MAEIQRDIFPVNITERIQTPLNRRSAISDLSVSKDRPFGGILYPVSQQGTK